MVWADPGPLSGLARLHAYPFRSGRGAGVPEHRFVANATAPQQCAAKINDRPAADDTQPPEARRMCRAAGVLLAGCHDYIGFPTESDPLNALFAPIEIAVER